MRISDFLKKTLEFFLGYLLNGVDGGGIQKKIKGGVDKNPGNIAVQFNFRSLFGIPVRSRRKEHKRDE
jgi:hypothetical protein